MTNKSGHLPRFRGCEILLTHTGVPLAPPPLGLTGTQACERLTMPLHNAVAMVAIAGKSIARGWTLSASGNMRSVYQLLAEIAWILAQNTAPEYDDLKERVRDAPVPKSSDDALADLTHLLASVEALRPELERHGVSWPEASVAHVRTSLLALGKQSSSA